MSLSVAEIRKLTSSFKIGWGLGCDDGERIIMFLIIRYLI